MTEDNTLLIRNARIFGFPASATQDVLIESGRVKAVADNIETPSSGCLEIDGKGMTLLPGLVDLHVHLREPGYSYKETVRTGSEAAAAGGFTTVCTMPNLNPVPDSMETLQRQLDIIGRDAVVEVLPFAAITKKRMGTELVDYRALAPYVAGFSDDGSGVQSSEVMERAMTAIAPTGKMLAAHCEVDALLKGGYIHDGEYARKHGHRGICSESEWEEVKRDIELAEKTGCRLHICHISTAESVELVRRGKERGVKVTCETGPHYLIMCDEDLREEGRFKMNPPLRSRRDMMALRRGIADGTIDVIATDHAPHSDQEKARGLEKSAMGVVGLETSLGAIYKYMVGENVISFERMVELMAINPRLLLGREYDFLQPGSRADLTLVDLDRTWRVEPDRFRTMGRATPFEGMEMKGKVMATLYGGKIAYINDSLK